MKRKDIATKLSKMSPEKPFLLVVGQEQAGGSFIILAASAKIYAGGNKLHMWWDTVSTRSAWCMKAFGEITFMANLSLSEVAGTFNKLTCALSDQSKQISRIVEETEKECFRLVDQWKI